MLAQALPAVSVVLHLRHATLSLRAFLNLIQFFVFIFASHAHIGPTYGHAAPRPLEYMVMPFTTQYAIGREWEDFTRRFSERASWG